ncbi:uncharacterized protein LOC111314497 [Durio zibethinus]|uniref:Uncharacterized protein LOC111314497 n=1 Tax=Durio zibethinus TaxID=66656 RepID=A0A6P6B383_DURZI|nr:uncharacterized protein LOC111314497 [Durio zibethinus]
MSSSGYDNSSDEAEKGYDMEFRSYPDDAWYSVRVLLEGEFGDKLRVKYDNFPDDHDNVFLAESFKSEDELYDFIGRFRKVSDQLQDAECHKVVKGMRVCASDSFGNDETLFYDAIVDDVRTTHLPVLHKKHSIVNGQEECECPFLLFWLHGPNVGNVTNKGVANICLLQDSKLQPILASFMEIALQKIEKASHKSVSGTSFTGGLRQRKCAWQSISKLWPSEGGTEVHCENRQDTDVGGDKNFYIILVQNLEKELSSAAVSEFIHKQTSIAVQVYIFPSLPWEPYTNGVIMLDCKKDLEQLFGFLHNPNHLIVSLNGRPWVATEKMSMNDHWTSMLESPNKLLNRRGGGFSNELKVVCSGTEEYKKAKELRDLFLQFIDHVKGLYMKLRMEERSIS